MTLKISKHRLFCVRINGEDRIHAYADGKHRPELCGVDYAEVRQRLRQAFPGRVVKFIRIPLDKEPIFK